MSRALPTPRTLLIAAAAVYTACFVAFVAFERPGLGIGHGFYLAIILVALASGPRAGAAAGLAATALYVLGVWLSPRVPVDFPTAVTTIRALAYVTVGAIIGWYASRNRALTDELTELTRHLRALADRDVLTGLPTMRPFELAITGRLDAAQPFALLVADLDGLAALNAGSGYEAGDDVLRRVSERLEHDLPVDSDIARVGGDEFALLVPCERIEDAAHLAARLEQSLRRGDVAVTLGWAMYPYEGTTALALYRAADERLYARKLLRSYGAGAPRAVA
jgi:diguanylate cyclase (GGDEF)-like protein